MFLHGGLQWEAGKGGRTGRGQDGGNTEKKRGASKHLNPPESSRSSRFSLQMMDPDGSNGDPEAEPMCHNCVAAVIQVSKILIIMQQS